MEFLQFIFFLASISAALILISSLHSQRKKCTAPQAAGAWPIIGHMHLFRSNQLTHKTLGSMADRYGPIFTIKLGSHTILTVNSHESAKEIFTVHDKALSDRPSIAASRILGYNNAMFGLTPYSSYWRQMRKIATTELLSNHKIQIFKHIIVNEVNSMLRELYMRSEKQGNGYLVDMKQKFGELTSNILLRMIGGKRYFGERAEIGEEEGRRFRAVMRDFMDHFGVFDVLADTMPFLGWLDFLGYEQRMKRTAEELDKVLEECLEEHKNGGLIGRKEKEKQDFMDVMLQVLEDGDVSCFDADTVIKATCLNLLLAGSDTTMVALTWVLSLLLNHPLVLKKVQDELDEHICKTRQVEDSDIKNLVYLQAVFKESLRLYPPRPLISLRSASEDCVLSNGNYRVPAGTRLMINVWKIHRDPATWPEPEEFKPERFLSSTHKDMDVRGQSFEFIPFGSGRRSCPGTSLALQVVQYSLASFLHSFDVSKPSIQDVDMTECAGLTNLKTTPLKVLIRPRLDSLLYESRP